MSTTALTQRQNRHLLQKIAKITAIISILVAIVMGGYLLTLNDSEDKVLKAFFGSVSFFCFMAGLVLHSIGSANLPDLSVPSDDEIQDQIREVERRKF